MNWQGVNNGELPDNLVIFSTFQKRVQPKNENEVFERKVNIVNNK